MNTVRAAGVAVTLAGFVGYLVGVLTPYPGRAAAITGIMAGITLTTIGQWGDTGPAER